MLLAASIGLALIIGNILALPVAIFAAFIGILMGWQIQLKQPKIMILLSSTVLFLIIFSSQYVISVLFLEMNFVTELFALLSESIQQSIKFMEMIGQTPDEKVVEKMNEMVSLTSTLIPSIFVLVSVMSVFLSMLINFPIARRLGVNVPKFQPFREMVLPKSILWYYLITLIVSLLIPFEKGSFSYMAFMNVSFILQFLFLLQGFSFIYFWSSLQKWPKAVPITLTIFVLIFAPLLYIIRLLGIIDLGFNLRQRLQQK